MVLSHFPKPGKSATPVRVSVCVLLSGSSIMQYSVVARSSSLSLVLVGSWPGLASIVTLTLRQKLDDAPRTFLAAYFCMGLSALLKERVSGRPNCPCGKGVSMEALGFVPGGVICCSSSPFEAYGVGPLGRGVLYSLVIGSARACFLALKQVKFTLLKQIRCGCVALRLVSPVQCLFPSALRNLVSSPCCCLYSRFCRAVELTGTANEKGRARTQDSRRGRHHEEVRRVVFTRCLAQRISAMCIR